MKNITNLVEFYELMFKTRDKRIKIVDDLIKGKAPNDLLLNELKEAHTVLSNISRNHNKYVLQLEADKTIELELDYEICELEKDLFFLTHSEKQFYDYLAEIHNNFTEEIEAGLNYLQGIKLTNFITDRDGTINNYCGRYISSIQSVYNAIFMINFAKKNVKDAVILTSAPLDKTGLVEISIIPKGLFVLAGSKGREYISKSLVRCQYPIEKEKKIILDNLNNRLKEIIEKPKYAKFALIGSGLQFKFGQTTIARQDISKTIDEMESLDFLRYIENLVAEIDPSRENFRIEDTGKDIEIILTVYEENSDKLKDFDKGDGVDFLDNDLNLNISKGSILICGDTASDLPMITKAIEKKANVYSIFVTKDEKLKEKFYSIIKNGLIVSEPDILITILNKLK